jgi:competence protein ComEC
MHSPDAIAVASTLILGYKADLSNDILQAYSKTGTIHVLSVSGAHVAIIYVLLNFLLSFLDKYKHGRIIKTITIITLIWYYSMLTGFSPAVCRASIMITMVIIGKAYSRYINTLNILAISAFALLIYDPYLIADVGFQLSYLAVFGLVVLQPIIYKWAEFKNKWADRLWMLCSASIAAQVITFPLSAYYFHQFPIYFLVSNLFMLIPSTIIMYVGISYLLLPQIPFLPAALGFVLEHTILLTNKVLIFIEYQPFASISKIWLTTLEYLLLYIIIGFTFYFLFKPKKWILKGLLAATLFLSIVISFKRWETNRSSDLVFLNLRKHSGMVFREGNSAIVVSDLADTDKNYKYSIQPYLDSCKIYNVHICNLNEKSTSTYFLKHDNLIQFRDKRIVIIDKQHAGIKQKGKFNVDYLFVTGNPNVDITYLNKNYNYQMLVIDGNNSNTLCDRLKNEASLLHIKYKILKRNNSLRIISKDNS